MKSTSKGNNEEFLKEMREGNMESLKKHLRGKSTTKYIFKAIMLIYVQKGFKNF